MKHIVGTRFNKKVYLHVVALICLLMIGSAVLSDIYAEEIKPGSAVTIITPGTEARLCPQSGCGPDQHITRIPEGTVLTIKGVEDYVIGTFKVKWFEVIYDENRGWISIYDTNKSPK
jgi:hypothetical protein